MNSVIQLYLTPKQSMPDYRLLITWLWSEFNNTDSDGNSFNPASNDWNELYLCNREKTNEVININPIDKSAKTLEITGSTKELIFQTAYFLAIETKGKISLDSKGVKVIGLEEMTKLVSNFDLNSATKRVAKSIWRKATLENPYPNLRT